MNYSRPSVMVNETLAEGVYAASGSTEGGGDCWTVGVTSVQDWSGDSHVYEVKASHSKEALHITTLVKYTFTFSQPLTSFRSEFTSYGSGNTWTVERDCHANGYRSGDEVTFKIWAFTGDQATTASLPAPSVSWSCRHEMNVQDQID